MFKPHQMVYFVVTVSKNPLQKLNISFTLAASNPNHDFEKTLFLLKWGEKITLNRNHKYNPQVQVQMGVTNIDKTYFVVWSPADYVHGVIEFQGHT